MTDRYFEQPKKRSRLRVLCGRLVYSVLRSVQWHLGGINYARLPRPSKRLQPFPYVAASHHSPIFRQLQDVDQSLQANKKVNLTLAIRSLDGLIVEPGQTLSYWKCLGFPSKRRGYLPGMILINGRPGVYTGGGLCQLSNLLYWITLHTPLTVTERFRHSYDVFPDSNRTQPFGSGATCVYNYRDLQIRNDLTEPYQLALAIVDDELVGQWRTTTPPGYRYEVYEKQHWISQAYQGVYLRNNVLHRRLWVDNALCDDQFVTENHALMMYSPLLMAPRSFQEQP